MPNVWSVHIRQSAHCVLPTVKAQPKAAAAALGEYSEMSQPTTFFGLLAGRNHRQAHSCIIPTKMVPGRNDDVPEGRR